MIRGDDGLVHRCLIVDDSMAHRSNPHERVLLYRNHISSVQSTGDPPSLEEILVYRV